MISFHITYLNGTTTQQAVTTSALQEAGNDWAYHLSGGSRINISVKFETLATFTIAQTSIAVVKDAGGVDHPRSYYKFDPEGYETDDDTLRDAEIDISDTLMWSNDLVSVLKHEIGHVLGLGHIEQKFHEVMSPYLEVNKEISVTDLDLLKGLGYPINVNSEYAVVKYAPDQEIVI